MKKFRIKKIIRKLASKNKKNSSAKNFFLYNLTVFGAVCTVVLVFLFGYMMVLLRSLPDVKDEEAFFAPQSTVIMDREGDVLYSIHGEENRRIIPLSKIPEHLILATLAIEDDAFYSHKGFDLKSIIRAAWNNFFHPDRKTQGGSTITQQFVKNAFLTPEKTYTRKLKELLLSMQVERKFSKDEILAMYLNRIPYGSNAYGVELAAQTFFGKSAEELSLAESVVIAALPQAPTYFSPYGQHLYTALDVDESVFRKEKIRKESDFSVNEISRGLLGKYFDLENGAKIYLKGRTDLILDRMERLGFIEKNEKMSALDEIKNISFRPNRALIKYPHFVMYIKEYLEKKYGKDIMEQGGLKVYTTLDSNLQEIAEKAIDEFSERNEKINGAKNASLIGIDPKTFQILAMVGSRDYFDIKNDGNVNVALRKRLPGSSFKPFVYAALFLQGYSPATVLFDAETDFGMDYRPQNFDGKFRGPVSIRQAIAHSINVPAVKAGYLAGISNVISLVKDMGIPLEKDENWYGLSLAIGTGETRLLDMVKAYSVFANNGVKHKLASILKIEDSNGNIVEAWKKDDGKQVLDKQAAYLINNVLSDASARLPEWNYYLQIKDKINAVKTGTSNKKKIVGGKEIILPADAWTIGYTPSLVAGVWGGNNDGSPIDPKASGFSVAAPIWNRFMTEALKEKKNEEFPIPRGIHFVKISTASGKLPTQYTPKDKIKTEVFASFSNLKEYDDAYQVVLIDRVTGLLASEECPSSAQKEEVFINYHSIRPDLPEWEEAVQKWLEENVKEGEQKEIPTEKCIMKKNDTRFFKPSLKLISPRDGQTVSRNFEVVPDIDAPNGILKVEIFLGNRKKTVLRNPPYRYNMRIFKWIKNGSVQNIRIRVYDKVYNLAEKKIKVKIGDDKLSPKINIIFPSENEKLIAGSTVVLRTEVTDFDGIVDRVELYKGIELAEKKESAPYDFSFTVPYNEGDFSFNLVAYDREGNRATRPVTFESIISSGELLDEGILISIVKPKEKEIFKFGQDLEIICDINKEKISDILKLEFYLKEGTIKRKKLGQISDFAGNTSGRVRTSIKNIPVGEYEFYIKAVTKKKKVRYSGRVNIKVEAE